MASRIPPLLEPYLRLPPEASLILLTNVLGASSNWLVLRFLYSILNQNPQDQEAEESSVVLVSFMRDFAFWREGARRLGLDLEKFSAKKRFVSIDGLSSLFLPQQGRATPQKPGEKALSNPELAAVSGEITQSINELKQGGSKVLLVVDQPDLLLAAGGQSIGAVNFSETLMDWREEAHSTILSVSADLPLVSQQQAPLEVDHAAFLLTVAHEADFTLGLRLLDTGAARDVSGVIRVTPGEVASAGNEKIEERELLYLVGGDGGVKVFERGQ